MHARLPVRLANQLHERVAGTWASVLLVSSYALASLLSIAPARNQGARVLAVARHANARRQVARVTSWIGAAECGTMRTGLKTLVRLAGLGGLSVLLPPRRLARALRIVRAFDSRYPISRVVPRGRSDRLVHARQGDARGAAPRSGPGVWRFQSGRGGVRRSCTGPGDSAGLRLSRVSDALLAAARFQSVDPRRRRGGAGPAAEGPDQGRGAARGPRGRIRPLGSATRRTSESGDRDLSAEGALMDDAGGHHRRLSRALSRAGRSSSAGTRACSRRRA